MLMGSQRNNNNNGSPECRPKIPLRCGKTMPNKQTQPSLNISHVRNCLPMSDEENLGLSKGLTSQRNVYITNRVEIEEARKMENSQIKSLSKYLHPGPGSRTTESQTDTSIRL